MAQSRNSAPIEMDVATGKPVSLDASNSKDPDGQTLQFNWFHYAEAGGTGASLAAVSITGGNTAQAVVTATATCRPHWLPSASAMSGHRNGTYHPCGNG